MRWKALIELNNLPEKIDPFEAAPQIRKYNGVLTVYIVSHNALKIYYDNRRTTAEEITKKLLPKPKKQYKSRIKQAA